VKKTYLTVDDRAILECDNKILLGHVKTGDAAIKYGHEAKTGDTTEYKLESTKIYDEVIEGDKELNIQVKIEKGTTTRLTITLHPSKSGLPKDGGTAEGTGIV
jgi:hypothetical protein